MRFVKRGDWLAVAATLSLMVLAGCDGERCPTDLGQSSAPVGTPPEPLMDACYALRPAVVGHWRATRVCSGDESTFPVSIESRPQDNPNDLSYVTLRGFGDGPDSDITARFETSTTLAIPTYPGDGGRLCSGLGTLSDETTLTFDHHCGDIRCTTVLTKCPAYQQFDQDFECRPVRDRYVGHWRKSGMCNLEAPDDEHVITIEATEEIDRITLINFDSPQGPGVTLREPAMLVADDAFEIPEYSPAILGIDRGLASLRGEISADDSQITATRQWLDDARRCEYTLARVPCPQGQALFEGACVDPFGPFVGDWTVAETCAGGGEDAYRARISRSMDPSDDVVVVSNLYDAGLSTRLRVLDPRTAELYEQPFGRGTVVGGGQVSDDGVLTIDFALTLDDAVIECSAVMTRL